tara:strand:- start:1070 stop:1747 length:678 start_codon:yes stop_codon:yes gene_type:complete
MEANLHAAHGIENLGEIRCDLQWGAVDLVSLTPGHGAQLEALKRFVTVCMLEEDAPGDPDPIWTQSFDAQRKQALFQAIVSPEVRADATRVAKQRVRQQSLAAYKTWRKVGVLSRLNELWPTLVADLLGMSLDAFEMLHAMSRARLEPKRTANKFALSAKEWLAIGLVFARNGEFPGCRASAEPGERVRLATRGSAPCARRCRRWAAVNTGCRRGFVRENSASFF